VAESGESGDGEEIGGRCSNFGGKRYKNLSDPNHNDPKIRKPFWMRTYSYENPERYEQLFDENPERYENPFG
jgi:hypothetical protein